MAFHTASFRLCLVEKLECVYAGIPCTRERALQGKENIDRRDLAKVSKLNKKIMTCRLE
jgi:hypothetical protein